MALPKKQRLTRSFFQKGLFGGRKSQHNILRVMYFLNKETRFGVIVSKKVEKTAVARNRIKRMVYYRIQEIITKEAKIPQGTYVFWVLCPEQKDKNITQNDIDKAIFALFPNKTE